MSYWLSKIFTCSSAKPVDVFKPGNLDEGQDPELKTDNSEGPVEQPNKGVNVYCVVFKLF